jgi:ATP-binding cassette subfamily G (WHITE) protein 2 (SNQ2)
VSPRTLPQKAPRLAEAAATMSEKETYEEASPKALEESAIGLATNTNTARTSIDTISDAETQRENARAANPHGFVRTTSGVDVKAAEAEFATLQKELTGISQTSRRLSRTQSKKNAGDKDIEKTAASDESSTDDGQFDLEGTLRGNHTVSDIAFNVGVIKALLPKFMD